jgi:GDPmannose 4,6-dehydratase
MRRGVDQTGRVLVEIDPRYFRPTEVEILIGNPAKAHSKLGWKHKTSFDALVREMVEMDRAAIQLEQNRRNRYE